MIPAKTILAVTAALAVGAPATASAAGSALNGSPWLSQLSGGAYVDFDVTKAPDHSTVTIDGKRAKVKTIREDGERFYRAIVRKPGLEEGERYKVTIKVTPRTGTPYTFSKRLVLHVARDRRPAGAAGS